jgi:hypothetical protein
MVEAGGLGSATPHALDPPSDRFWTEDRPAGDTAQKASSGRKTIVLGISDDCIGGAQG